jgi:NADP-dependent 3-hydroxy acid dehydrogenase YdfG
MKPSIFITGAAKGIGRATALLFAKKGWFVGLFDIDLEALQVLSQEIEQIATQQNCFAFADVRDEESVQKAIAFFGQHTQNQMNILLNNAGVLQMGFLENIPLAQQKTMIDVNIWGVINTTY